ncbi:MAG: lysostaphin resistance A-like protein [Chloroflexota bacterium]
MTTRHRQAPNPAVVFLRLLAAVLALTAICVTLFFVSPGSIGLLPEDYLEKNEAYSFTSLTVQGAYIRLEMPMGTLVPTYRGGKVSGCVVLGKGRVILDFPAPYEQVLRSELGVTRIEDTISAAFIPASYSGVEFLKDSAHAQPIPDFNPEDAAVFLAQRAGALRPVRFLGASKFNFADQAAASFVVAGETLGHIRYAEGQQVDLTIPSINRSVRMPNLENKYSPFLTVFAGRAMAMSTLFMSLAMVAMILALTFVTTLDLTRLAPPVIPHSRKRAEIAVLAGMLALVLGKIALTRRFGLGDWAEAAFMVLIGILLVYVLRWRLHHLSTFGLDAHNLTRSLLTAALVGPLTASAGALSFPSGPRSLTPLELTVTFLFSFGVVGFLRETFLRGYVQGTLSRLIGPRRAIIATSLIMGTLQLLGNLAAGVRPSMVFWLEALLVVPVNAAILGYLYYRTSNLSGNILAAGLMDFLPKVLKY